MIVIFNLLGEKTVMPSGGEQMIGRHNGPRFYSVLTGLFVAAAVETVRADTFLRKPDRFDQRF